MQHIEIPLNELFNFSSLLFVSIEVIMNDDSFDIEAGELPDFRLLMEQEIKCALGISQDIGLKVLILD